MKPRAKKSPRSGFVYLIRCKTEAAGQTPPEPGLYKIGRASSLDGRLSSLQSGCPFLQELVASGKFDDPQLEEFKLHTQYARYRTRGEWFELPKASVDKIKARLLHYSITAPKEAEEKAKRLGDLVGALEREREEVHRELLSELKSLYQRLPQESKLEFEKQHGAVSADWREA